MKTVKVTSPMLDLLTKLGQGWTTYHAGGPAAYCAVQQGKVGYGGKSEFVHSATWFAVFRRGYLRMYEQDEQSRNYTLSEEGIAVLKAHGIAVHRSKLPKVRIA